MNTSCLSFQSKVYPPICLILSFGFSIGVTLSLYLSSEEAYATTSSPTLSVLAIPTPPSTTNPPVVLEVDCVDVFTSTTPLLCT